MRVMEINAEQESLAARRAMEESTRHARDAARDAQQALHEVSSDASHGNTRIFAWLNLLSCCMEKYHSLVKRNFLKCHSKKSRFTKDCLYIYLQPSSCTRFLEQTILERINGRSKWDLCEIIFVLRIKNMCMVCILQIRMQQSSNWQESAARLIETQENAAKAAQTAYNQLARVNI